MRNVDIRTREIKKKFRNGSYMSFGRCVSGHLCSNAAVKYVRIMPMARDLRLTYANRRRVLEDTTFQVAFAKDAVYCTINNRVRGVELDAWMIIDRLKQLGIKDISSHAMLDLVDGKGPEHIKLAPAQKPHWVDQTMNVVFSDFNVEAFIVLSSCDKMGRRMSYNEIINILTDEQGILEEYILKNNIEYALENRRSGEKVMAAAGVPPVEAKDGVLEWSIQNQDDADVQSRWKVVEGDIVNYKEISLFECVEADQLLVKALPPTPGKPGTNVFGIEVTVGEGVAATMPRGENVYYSADKTELYAKVGGRVSVKGDWIKVNNRYVVDGDVDLKVGNIDFPGDVVIHGGVLSGFSVRAGGNVEIYGTVESANIYAKQKLALYRGVQGNGAAVITSGAGIRARFVENATLISYGNLFAESIIQCDVSADGYIDVTKGRGAIIGGSVIAGKSIATKVLGSPGGIQTRVQVGITDNISERRKQLIHSIEKAESKCKHLSTFIDWNDGVPSRRFASEISIIEQSRDQMKDELAELEKVIDDMKYAKIHATSTANINVKMAIADVPYTTREAEPHVSFVVEDEAKKTASGEKRMFSPMDAHIKSISCMYDKSMTGEEN